MFMSMPQLLQETQEILQWGSAKANSRLFLGNEASLDGSQCN